MASHKIIISPKTKIGELLEAFPELESVLIRMSPVFEKLKNPILRRTVARVATIQQISVVGGIPVEQIVNRLRAEVGQTGGQEDLTESRYMPGNPPSWFDENKITQRFDATHIINSGESPMNDILRKALILKPGEILELQTPFIPAPILDMLIQKNYMVFSLQSGEAVRSYISKKE